MNKLQNKYNIHSDKNMIVQNQLLLFAYMWSITLTVRSNNMNGSI